MDKEEFRSACRLVFGEKGIEELTMVNVEGLNLYYTVIECSEDTYRVSFLPESWADALHKDERIWSGCKWSGFFDVPLMAVLCFYVGKDQVTHLGQLIMDPGKRSKKDRRKHQGSRKAIFA